jgi:hypothetical protein
MSRDPVVVVPGDLDVEDRIAGPVTFRMAAWLAAAGAGVALVAASRGAVAPTALGVVLLVVGIAGAWWRPGGRPVGAWVAPLLAYRRRRRSFTGATAEDEVEVVVSEPSAVEPEPAEEPHRAVVTPWRPGRVVAVGVTGALVVAAVVSLVVSRDAAPSPAAPVADVVVPEPAANPPIVVVVPVDPFTGWEVGGDVVDPLCGC